MKLTAEQHRQFEDNGFLLVPDVFSLDEVIALRDESTAIFQHHRPEIWREKNGEPRTAFGCHEYNEVFRALTLDSRLVEPVEQIIGEQLYIHQFKVNPKVAFEGDTFPWHQDFVTWHEDDGMPEARAMNAAIFLDDVHASNGALMFVPGSHKEGMIYAEDVNGRRWLEREDVVRLIRSGDDIAIAEGRAGSVLLFHGDVVHGSAGNITPLPRRILYVTYSALSNHLRRPTRPPYIAHRSFEPIVAVERAVQHATSQHTA
ncbi:phytanoyl-CoA dioxygenase family protein [Paraburkholderia phenazinium]|uniref:phytanoyl-CoA dioxygenase family protein n=1 Tax=Paraburkholderia phenazinium TaxID=60549 RepID=UPI00158C8EFC|nr:phytanoyl-CoA dioxygenase family protein [Paraburkholderia phenazinium]